MVSILNLVTVRKNCRNILDHSVQHAQYWGANTTETNQKYVAAYDKKLQITTIELASITATYSYWQFVIHRGGLHFAVQTNCLK